MAEGFVGLEVAGGEAEVGGADVDGGVVVVVSPVSLLLSLSFLPWLLPCWLVSPLSLAAMLSSGPSAALP